MSWGPSFLLLPIDEIGGFFKVGNWTLLFCLSFVTSSKSHYWTLSLFTHKSLLKSDVECFVKPRLRRQQGFDEGFFSSPLLDDERRRQRL